MKKLICIDYLWEIINNSSAYRFDGTLWSIIREEAEYYFADVKSAEEVARIIQSRASIYLAEQYG